MTEENMALQKGHPWSFFWANLKEAYDIFEQERRPPQVAVCGNRYLVRGPDDDMAMPLTPRRMVKLARMMTGQFPVKSGECHEEPVRRSRRSRLQKRWNRSADGVDPADAYGAHAHPADTGSRLS